MNRRCFRNNITSQVLTSLETSHGTLYFQVLTWDRVEYEARKVNERNLALVEGVISSLATKNFDTSRDELHIPKELILGSNIVPISSLNPIVHSVLMNQGTEPYIIASKTGIIPHSGNVELAMILLGHVSQYYMFALNNDPETEERIRKAWNLADLLARNYIPIFNGGNNSIADFHIQLLHRNIDGHQLSIRNDVIPHSYDEARNMYAKAHQEKRIVFMAALGNQKFGLVELLLPIRKFRDEIRNLIHPLLPGERHYNSLTRPFPLYIPYDRLNYEEIRELNRFNALGIAAFEVFLCLVPIKDNSAPNELYQYIVENTHVI